MVHNGDMEALQQAIDAAGGVTRLAEFLGLRSKSSVTNWKRRTGQVPAGHARAVSKITGIPLHELRPDIYEAPRRARRPSKQPERVSA